MEYQITCVCGHQFLISDDQVEQPVTCPACQRRLNPVVVAPGGAANAGAAAGTQANAEATKRCPFCGEVILAVARKCKHCGEFLDRTAPGEGGATLPPGGAGPQGGDATATGNAAAAAGVAPVDTTPVFSLAVSQWDNFWKFVILFTIVVVVAVLMIMVKPLQTYAAVGIPAALVFAGFIAWFYYLSAKHTRVIIRPFRIDTESGILSKKLDSLELFRISDVELKQGLVERMLGIGTVKLMTSDSTSEPELVLYQIPRAREVYKYIQTQIPIAAKQRGAIYMEK